MAKYYRRPDGLYETSRTVNGKRVRFRGHTCAEVDRKILEFKEEKKRGRKMSAVIDEWFEEKQKEGMSHSTIRSYAFTVDRLTEYFGPIYAADVTPRAVQQYVREFERQGYAKSSVGIELAVIKQVFSFAVLCGDIDVSPAVEVKRSKNLPTKKRNALTEAQEALVERCRTGRWWLFGLMLLYTGCRRGELLALNWQDIDRDAGVIHITKKLDYSYGVRPVMDHHLKSENGKRDVPIFSPLAAALPRACRLGPIFTGDDGNYLTAGEIQKMWVEYCGDVGLLGTDGAPAVTPHCFRHSFSTICFEAGIDAKDAAAFLGDTEDVMRNVYTQLREAHHATSTEKLNAFFEMRAEEREAK